MGLVALGPSADPFSVLSDPAVGVGATFVTVTVIYLTAYLSVAQASGSNREQLRRSLIMASVPLFLAFLVIILFISLREIEVV